MNDVVKRVILKLMQQVMGCKVSWSEEELKLMRDYLEDKV